MTWKEIPAIQEALNIHGNDVEALFKVYQTIPDSVGVLEMKFELKNKNPRHIHPSPTAGALKHFEKYGKKELQKTACGIDVWAFADTARHFNPKMKCTNLKLPLERTPASRLQLGVQDRGLGREGLMEFHGAGDTSKLSPEKLRSAKAAGTFMVQAALRRTRKYHEEE